MAEIQWFYARGGEQLGPVNPAALRQLALSAALSGNDLVWREGMDDWAPARSVKGLFPDQKDAVAGSGLATTSLDEPAEFAGGKSSGRQPPSVTPSSNTTPPNVTPPMRLAPQSRGEPATRQAPISDATPLPTWTISQATQVVLWVICALIVIIAGCQFTVAIMRSENPTGQANSAAVFTAYFVGAYVLARAGERLCSLIDNWGGK